MLPSKAAGLGLVDAFALGAAGLWSVWVVIATLHAGRPPLDTLPYLAVPLMAVVGVALGRRAAHVPPRSLASALLALGTFFALSAALTSEPGKLPTTYPNANAAVGVQLLALTGLASLGCRAPGSRPVPRGTGGLLLASALAAVGVLAINDSQAGWAVAAPVLVIVVASVVVRRGPWRWLQITAALVVMGAGVAGLVWLARLAVWPDVALRALHPVRQQLWRTALDLWGQHRLTGGGAGSFAAMSPLAIDPDTAPAHSSVLQVASEFGLIGLVLFGLVLVAGLALALRGDAATAVIAVSAWTALFVHSLMDHLYHFGSVTLFAAAVVGWAGAQKSSTSPSVSRQCDAGGGVAASGRDVRIGPAPGTGSGTRPADGPVLRPMA